MECRLEPYDAAGKSKVMEGRRAAFVCATDGSARPFAAQGPIRRFRERPGADRHGDRQEGLSRAFSDVDGAVIDALRRYVVVPDVVEEVIQRAIDKLRHSED